MAPLCVFVLFLILLLASSSKAGETPRERALALVAQMNLTEKIAMVHGHLGTDYSILGYVGEVKGNSELGIPALHLEDSPQGVGDLTPLVTAWPSALTVLASWDTFLQRSFAQAMATEQYIKGSNIMLAPMVNIARVPRGGRNFESYGEDPFLASVMVRECVLGVQSLPMMACVKHFVNNNQETNRSSISAVVDDRTQHEIYYPAFKAAVEAGVASAMCSYNKINGTYACENPTTISVLKNDFGFEGFLMSDWGATHPTAPSALAGLDQEMPGGFYFGETLLIEVEAGRVPLARLDDMVTRILTSMFRVGLFESSSRGTLFDDANSLAHNLLARQLGANGIVLLKNADSLLPLNMAAISSILVVGDNNTIVCDKLSSGYVIPPYIVTPYEGIAAKAAQTSPRSSVSYVTGDNIQAAASLASKASVVVVVVATDSREGADRANLSLPLSSDNLVSALAQANQNTVVVVRTPGAVLMPWVGQVSAIVCEFLGGQEAGNSLADVLFGDVNPSARLPISFPASEDDTWLQDPSQFPGIDGEAFYSEKLLVGYRWYTTQNITPLFPFGHGLSYTSFSYSNLNVVGSISSTQQSGSILVSCSVLNSGSLDGSEVVQLYLGFPSSAMEPALQLKGFSKVFLPAGQAQTVSVILSPAEASVYDVAQQAWVVATGVFNVYVGASSQDLRLSGTFTISA